MSRWWKWKDDAAAVDTAARRRNLKIQSRFEVDFLAARLPEAERDARAVLSEDMEAAQRLARWALSDCAAQRRILESWRRYATEASIHRQVGDVGASVRAEFAALVIESSALANLVEAYSGHPDFKLAYPPRD